MPLKSGRVGVDFREVDANGRIKGYATEAALEELEEYVDSSVDSITTSLATKAVKPAVVSQTSPTAITLADNTIYELGNVLTLALTYPSGSIDCYLNITTAAEGEVSISFPPSLYQPDEPEFGNGELWTIWIRSSSLVTTPIVTAQKVVFP